MTPCWQINALKQHGQYTYTPILQSVPGVSDWADFLSYNALFLKLYSPTPRKVVNSQQEQARALGSIRQIQGYYCYYSTQPSISLRLQPGGDFQAWPTICMITHPLQQNEHTKSRTILPRSLSLSLIFPRS